MQNKNNTNWKEEVQQSLFFVEVTTSTEIVKVYRWYSTDRYKAVDEVIKQFKDEIPNHTFVDAYQVK
jgi:hypothetical protein